MHDSPVSVAGSRYAHLDDRLPAQLTDLAGPTTGPVELPLHLAWSGLRTFDLDDERLLLGLYRIVLAEGLAEDMTRYLNAGLLLANWPRLRKMIGKQVRAVWEGHFPELTRAAAA